MVTHDIGLKNFGHRIVRVVDGKINNEYLVNEKEREECVRKLYERIDLKKGIREGAQENESNQSKTVYRKPTDYKIKKANRVKEEDKV